MHCKKVWCFNAVYLQTVHKFSSGMEGNGQLSTLFTALDIAIKPHTEGLVYPDIACLKRGEISHDKRNAEGK